ncbi:uncharacterized protein LOC135371138 [Ornithodoros turicata]|uniref:uncharacterized protein LOC135371138 n=1 Tax=Ornithodoros turicata TaxID=34597 RepID=UPI003139B787
MSNSNVSLLPDMSIITESLILQDPLDYRRVELPSFGTMESVLQRKEPISRKVRRFIVCALYQEAAKVTWYPSARLYHKLVDALLSKYEHLRDPLGTGMESWKEALRRKYKNERRKMNAPPPAVVGIRQKNTAKERPAASAVDSSHAKVIRLHDAEHLLHDVETVDSLAEHDLWLRDVSCPADTTVYRDRLAVTAKPRRDNIKTISVVESLRIYPFLKDETARIHGSDRCNSLQHNVERSWRAL